MEEPLRELGAAIVESLGAQALGFDVQIGWLELRVERTAILEVLRFLRDDPRCQFRQLTDIAGVDWLGRAPRFDVVYHLLSLHLNRRIRVKIGVEEGETVQSAVAVYPCADWFEREAFDMYGIVFVDHPDLRRILTDYGFQGHPFRKDFPLTGYVELRYDDEQRRVVYEPVKLQQEFRSFDFMSPWEGAEYLLPGDEKAQLLEPAPGLKKD